MGRPTLGPSKTERIPFMAEADEVRLIDDWRFANRVASRAEAIRQLIRKGLSCYRTERIVGSGDRPVVVHLDFEDRSGEAA